MQITPHLAAFGCLFALPALAQTAASPPPPMTAPPMTAPAVTAPAVTAPAAAPPSAVTAPIPVPGIAPPAPAFSPGVYGVIMLIDLDPEGRMKDMRVSRVLAMAREASGEISTPLPDVFLASVHKRLQGVRFKEQGQIYRFFVFDPSQPARADIGPAPDKQ